jgi:hypothetical protein
MMRLKPPASDCAHRGPLMNSHCGRLQRLRAKKARRGARSSALAAWTLQNPTVTSGQGAAPSSGLAARGGRFRAAANLRGDAARPAFAPASEVHRVGTRDADEQLEPRVCRRPAFSERERRFDRRAAMFGGSRG